MADDNMTMKDFTKDVKSHKQVKDYTKDFNKGVHQMTIDGEKAKYADTEGRDFRSKYFEFLERKVVHGVKKEIFYDDVIKFRKSVLQPRMNCKVFCKNNKGVTLGAFECWAVLLEFEVMIANVVEGKIFDEYTIELIRQELFATLSKHGTIAVNIIQRPPILKTEEEKTCIGYEIVFDYAVNE